MLAFHFREINLKVAEKEIHRLGWGLSEVHI